MIRAKASIEIDRPVEEVFPYTANPENFPEWGGNRHRGTSEGTRRKTAH